MDIHKNARLTFWSREVLVQRVALGMRLKVVADNFQVTSKTAAKWVARYRALGSGGLQDRSSRPLRLRRPTQPELAERVEQLRRQRWTNLRHGPWCRPTPKW